MIIVHGHGEDFVNFALDCKLYILNGCLNPQNDNFTYISNQGRSVVDYICVPHDCFNMCDSFRVYTINETEYKMSNCTSDI